MPFNLPAMIALATACAPGVAPETLLAVAQVESAFDPLAIGVNGPGARRLQPQNLDDAVTRATALIAAGRSVDLGLAQINSRNLAWLGLTPRSAFDPCRNLAAGATVLEAGYRRASPRAGAEQAGLRTALSYYNTGHPSRGVRNGYVDRVSAAAARLPPLSLARESVDNPPPAAWDVFAPGRARGGPLVFATPSGAR